MIEKNDSNSGVEGGSKGKSGPSQTMNNMKFITRANATWDRLIPRSLSEKRCRCHLCSLGVRNMKVEFEPGDIEPLARKVAEYLKPLVSESDAAGNHQQGLH
jgi:hypothetical protein